MAHTKGPWEAKELVTTSAWVLDWVVLGPEERGRKQRIDATGKFDKDDAHLIATAPELLEFIKKIRNDPASVLRVQQLWDADALIAKAEGRS